MVSSPQQVFDKYIFKVSDYAIEGITDKVQNAIELNKVEQAFSGSTWKFYKDGEFNVTNGNTKELSFKIEGNNLILDDGNTKSQAQLSSKSSLYKLRITEGNGKPVILVLEPAPKKGYDLYSKKELRKYSFTYLGSNEDMYFLKQGAAYSNGGRNIYYNITPNGVFEHYVHYAKQGSEGELYYSATPISNFNMSGFELVCGGFSSSVKMPVSKNYTQKHYTESNFTTKETNETLIFGDYTLSVEEAYGLMKGIASKLPADKKAIFEKGKVQREALVAAQNGREEVEKARIREEMAKRAAENPAAESGSSKKPKDKTEVMVKLHNQGKVKVNIEIKKPGKSSGLQTFIVSNTMERHTMKIGSVVYVNGGAVLTVTEAMEGTTQVIAR